jgi:hypothetical protein
VAATHQGLLLIADITGYTRFLTASELEHAQGVLESLLGVLIDNTKPPLRISGFEGDAILSYTIPGVELAGQTFVEIVEQCYVKFRQQMDLMVLNNSCGCNACANIGTLDLKFFVHHGNYGLQHLGNNDELVGGDVILIHRLLKNHVGEATGIRAYTVYTRAAADTLGLDPNLMVPHQESYEDFGTVDLLVQDMHPLWEDYRSRTITQLPQQVALSGQTEIALPPPVVWDYLSKPEFRSVLLGASRVEVSDRQPGGRIGEGSTFVCYHGDRQVRQLILEWRPFDRYVTRDPFSPGTSVVCNYQLTPTESGTRLEVVLGDLEGPRLKTIAINLMLKAIARRHRRDLERFRDAIETHFTETSAAAVS